MIDKTLKIEKKSVEIDLIELYVSKGPDEGKRFSISSQKTLIGTSPSCDIRLNDPTISKNHCKITWDDERKLFFVEDLGSTNGTYLNGIRIEKAYLSSNRVIMKLGETEIICTALDRKRKIELFPENNFFGCIGVSTIMREIFANAMKFAQTDLNILIEGETGVGKEELAKAIHRASPRREKNFVVCDMTTIDKNLVLSELFGYEKGAFTGAEKPKKGLVEEAEGGTLFIDEIGEIPIHEQANLLRFVEKKEFRPIGSTKVKFCDVRIISATSKNIDEEIERGNFRQDLFYRLSQVRIKIPPLRERKEDIFPLIRYFLEKLSEDRKEVDKLYDFLSENSSAILGYDWPGNIRELKNFTERFFYIWKTTGKLHIDLAKTEPKFKKENLLNQDFKTAKQKIIEEFESNYVRNLYEMCRGNISECARIAKINRKYMEKLVRKYIEGKREDITEEDREDE